MPNVQIPMGILSAITGDAVPFRWGYTEQRAFEEVKSLVHTTQNHRRVPLDDSVGAPPIWMITPSGNPHCPELLKAVDNRA